MAEDLEDEYQGTALKVVHCDGAVDSFQAEIQHVAPVGKREKLKRALILQIRRLSNGHRLSKEHFPAEGELPKGSGKFFALKRVPIRAYGWYSKKFKNTFYISHYKFKNQQKLDSKDSKRVAENWNEIEGD